MDNFTTNINTILFYSFFEESLIKIFNDTNELKDTNELIAEFEHLLSDETLNHNVISQYYKDVLEDMLTTHTYQDIISNLKKQSIDYCVIIPDHFTTLFSMYMQKNQYIDQDSNTIEIYLNSDEQISIKTITDTLNQYVPKKSKGNLDNDQLISFRDQLWYYIEDFYYDFIQSSNDEIISEFLSNYSISQINWDIVNELALFINETYSYTLDMDQLLAQSLYYHPLILQSKYSDCDYLECIDSFIETEKPDLDKLTEKELICQVITSLSDFNNISYYYNEIYSSVLTMIIHSQGYTLCDFYNERVRNTSKFLKSLYKNIFNYEDVYPQELYISIVVDMSNYEDLAEIYAYYNKDDYSKRYKSPYIISKDTYIEINDCYNSYCDESIILEKDISLNYLMIDDVFIDESNDYNNIRISSDTIYKD